MQFRGNMLRSNKSVLVTSVLALVLLPGVYVAAQPGASVLVNSGNSQVTAINTAFTNPLEVLVLDGSFNPVSGASVTLTAPSSGASLLFSNSLTSITVTTSSLGLASATATANGI